LKVEDGCAFEGGRMLTDPKRSSSSWRYQGHWDESKKPSRV